jgi:hypothetical protein
VAVSLRRPRSDVFDFLGFPWILSSESSLFNGLRGLKRGNFFLSPFPWRRKAPEREPAVEAMRKRRIAHRASLI